MKHPYISFLKLIVFSSLALVVSCEKESLSGDAEASALPVVEAYLAVGQPISVQISKQIPLSSGSVDASGESFLVSGLAPMVSVDNTLIPLQETAPGIYESDTTSIVQADKQYQLSFEFNGQTISATTDVPQPPTNFEASRSTIIFETNTFPPSFPDPITLTWEAENAGSFYQIGLQPIEENPELLEFLGGGSGQERPQISVAPQQTNTYELTARDFSYAGKHQVVLYHVTPEYVSLTQTSASADNQNITTPFSNIVGGLGIFTGVGTDTLTVVASN
ncbi:MAG: DUF4249 family protein [Bacteroidota bacterium]